MDKTLKLAPLDVNNYFVGYILYAGETIIALSLGFKKPWMNGMEYYIDQFCAGISYQGQAIQQSNFILKMALRY